MGMMGVEGERAVVGLVRHVESLRDGEYVVVVAKRGKELSWRVMRIPREGAST